MVTDQKGHASRHESGGADTINHDSLTGFVANEHIDHSTVNISAGNALTGGGDITASRTIDVATGGIGTNEVDESANFSFSNLGATTINGNLDMSDNRIKNAVVDTDGDLAFFDDTEIHFGNDVDFKLDFQSSTGQMVFRDTNNNFIWGFDTSGVDFRGLNLNDVASIDGGGNAISVNDAINLGNSNSIQDSGVDAIQFNGTGQVILPEALTLGGNIATNKSSLDISTAGGGSDRIRITDSANGFSPIAEFNEGGNVTIPNGGLDVSGQTTIGSTTPNSRLGLFVDSSALSSGNTGVRFVGNDDSNTFIHLGDPSAPDNGRIVYDNPNDSLSLQTVTVTGLSIDSSQNVTIPNGDLNITNGNDIELSNGDGRIATGAGKDTFKKMRNESSLSDTGKAELINEEGFGGMVVVNNRSGGSAAIFMIDDGANSVTEVADPSNSFSTTEGNAGTTNVYWDSTNSRYEIENQEGAPKAYGIHLLT